MAGSTWKSAVVPGAKSLQFRDVQGVSAQVAYLMSIRGKHPGDFRIYKTEDGGAHWTIEFKNKTVNAFYDCFAFWTAGSRHHAQLDSVNELFPDIRTTDGTTWHSDCRKYAIRLVTKLRSPRVEPASLPKEPRNAWITTGGSSIARILATRDGGDSWTTYDTPAREQRQCGRLLGGVPQSLAWDCGWRRSDHEQRCPRPQAQAMAAKR